MRLSPSYYSSLKSKNWSHLNTDRGAIKLADIFSDITNKKKKSFISFWFFSFISKHIKGLLTLEQGKRHTDLVPVLFTSTILIHQVWFV